MDPSHQISKPSCTRCTTIPEVTQAPAKTQRNAIRMVLLRALFTVNPPHTEFVWVSRCVRLSPRVLIPADARNVSRTNPLVWSVSLVRACQLERECLSGNGYVVCACVRIRLITHLTQTNPWAIITSSPQLKCLSYFIYAWYTSVFPKTMESL